MTHLAPPTARHRRREQLVGLVLLLVGASMALLAISAFTHSKVRPTSLKPAASPSTQRSGTGQSRVASALRPTAQPAGVAGHVAEADPASAGSLPGSAPLVVLQNTGNPDLARNAAENFAARGWTVTQTSSFEGEILSTAAYYDPAIPGAQAAAERLQAQFAEIARVRPKFEGLPLGPIVVVVTDDYSQGHTTS